MIKEAIQKLVEGKDLMEEEAVEAMNCIMEGEATAAQIGSFITALRIKGETVEEITGCAKVMRQKAEKIEPDLPYCIDTCGTGGDGADTFNISTASALVAAAGGAAVAKHGNRSVSSKSGSADVLEALGVYIELTPGQVRNCIEKLGIGFMFAPGFHKSMKHAAGPRRDLGIRSIFNILGPLTNPAASKGHVLGVFDEKLTGPLARVLKNLGTHKALVVHGMDGLDEITVTGPTKVSELKDGEIFEYYIHPEEFGLQRASIDEVKGGNARENADIITRIFNGEKGPKRDITVINSAAALYVGKVVDSLEDGIKLSEEIIDSRKALNKLLEFKEHTNRLAVAQEL
ncbi:MAG: anthranilate phosphoribosyltransferase [Clostridiales bacterium]|jgi:anthranilate phosphoribosyltransferase|nr:anthranilate phosphoribosyltransferase [Eubacteriales bacterium]MDH7565286.1 anthranilate phosphoribosyltransferase [Clostridiales bacterium]